MTEQELKALQETDVRDIDPAALADIADVKIDTSLPPEQRMSSFIQQMNGNPYFFRCGRLVVKTTFRGEARLQTLLENCLETL